MASITITVPDEKVSAVLDAFARVYHRLDMVPDPDWVDPHDGTTQPLVPNPMTKAAFAKYQVAQFIKGVYTQDKATQAKTVYKNSVESAAAEIIGVE